MIKLLMMAIFGFVIYSVVVMLIRTLSGKRPSAPPREKTASGEEMVKDPQCGTYLPRSDALIHQVKGQTCYFCSEECRTKYST